MLKPMPHAPRQYCRMLRIGGILLLAALLWPCRAAEPLREGTRVPLPDGTVTVTRLASLPVVENDYSRRYRYDTYENPKLRQLREQAGLDAVVASGRNEFEKQLLLMDWVHQRFPRFGSPTIQARGALEILTAIDGGHTFFCSQYAQLLVSAAASLGWVDRPLALRRHQGVNRVGGSTEHSVTEIWSNQHAKWVMLDPTSNLHVETNGVPLNAVEIRQEWFYHGGTNLVFIVGPDQKPHRKSELPVRLRRFEGFGELTFEPDETDKYGFIGFIPNTDLMDSGFDYAGMFIVKDALGEGTQWHVRPNPSRPETDPYFPLGQAALRLESVGSGIHVTLETQTPNFQQFEIRIDDGAWTAAAASVDWVPHAGHNRFQARTRNRFGVTGPVSVAELDRSTAPLSP